MHEHHYGLDFLIKTFPLSPSLSVSISISIPLCFFHSLLLYIFLPTLDNVDREALGDLFNQYDSNKSGSITLDELETMLSHLGVGKLLLTVNLWTIQRIYYLCIFDLSLKLLPTDSLFLLSLSTSFPHI